MKKTILFTVILLLLFALVASVVGGKGSSIGTKYNDVYSSESLKIEDYNGENQHYISFDSLNGSYVCRPRKTTNGEGEVNYTAFITSGELKIYYDAHGQKELLATITPGETCINSGGYIKKGQQVYIIIEATDATDGYVYINF